MLLLPAGGSLEEALGDLSTLHRIKSNDSNDKYIDSDSDIEVQLL